MDILGPLPKALRAAKYLLVIIDYFTKWIETRPLPEITTNKVETFTWKHLICRYDLPYTIFTNNGTQFNTQACENILTKLGIKNFITSVEHPQTNGQAEATNKVILSALDSKSPRVYGRRSSPIYYGLIIVHPRQRPMKLLTDSHMAHIS